MRDDAIVGLDIGTTKICCIIAKIDEENNLKVVGVGKAPSVGLRKGVVINLEQTVQSIKRAVREAERMAGTLVKSVFAGIAGDHIRGINSRGVIAVSRTDREITPSDVDRVIEAAKAIAIPMDREIIHVLPQEFIVDDQSGITEPIGMAGVRLEAEVHIVTGAVTSAQNIYKSITRAGLDVRDIVLEPLASAYSVLNPDEKELGVVLIDIGGGTTDSAIFFEGSIRHTSVIGLGGNNVTNDIAIGLRCPVNKAEEIKKTYGNALSTLVQNDEIVRVPSIGGREERDVARHVLASIIEPRMEELFQLTLREIKKTDYSDLLAAGVVITGGAAGLEGIPELGEQIFGMPVKIGYPNLKMTGLTEMITEPMYATSVGLILYGLEHRDTFKIEKTSEESLFDQILDRMKSWFADFF
ncbi:MAG: cell division protein FtsA [Candidatus Cloacimonetes bacterium 4572_55]|nr:MAG: cell division protein FtsA [Candidatus Cloacimonetes bacterium 4572_55]